MIRVIMAGIVLATAVLNVRAARTEIPLKQVALFTSGVGYFERSAEISGATETELNFKTEQINDLLKSLVLLDESGAPVRAATYESSDPVERTLKSFSVDLTDNPNLGDLLNRMRGIAVRVNANARDWTGLIIGVETQKKIVEREICEVKILNLMSGKSARAIPLETVQEIEVLEPSVQSDLESALQTLAGSHEQGKKKVRLNFASGSKRIVRVGYMLETPVWKTSYRLVIENGREPFLQGWAHVENMTDEDWDGVTLSLFSGRPLSFIQNLYDPLYLRRPVVRMAQEAGLAPPEYEGALNVADGVLADAPAVAKSRVRREFAAKMAAGAPPQQERAMRMDVSAEDMGGGAAESMAAAHATGELFEYQIREPLTLPRRQSAMLPIVNQTVKGRALSIFDAAVNSRHPLNGLEIENTSGLFLMQGPATVFEDGMYAGDARLPDTQRGEKRLLSYALDLAVEARLESRGEPEEIVSMKIIRGALIFQRKFVNTVVYTFRSKRDKERNILIEHPLREGWTLVEPAEGVEKTRNAYRFCFRLAGGKTADMAFREQRVDAETLALADTASEHIGFFINQKKISAALRQALGRFVAMQRELEDLRQARAQKELRLRAITQDQTRIRENMKTVNRNSESYAMWERKLVEQEKEIDQLALETEKMRGEEHERSAALAQFLAELNVE